MLAAIPPINKIRHIIHADLDAFFASVEELDNPELLGKPILVGGSAEGRGVVATASYAARKFGAHSAMPMKTAVRLCPQAVVIYPRFSRYKELSTQVMDIFRQLTPLVEPMSSDEAYLDITDAVTATRPPLAIALELKERVKQATGLTISIGAATSKSVAKIASDYHKPDGLVVVPPGQEAEFLAPLPVGKLPGIGPKTAEALRQEGVQTIGQLAERPLEWHLKHFGKRAAHLKARAAGQDWDPVQTDHVTKSCSAETTFPTDLTDPERLYAELSELAEDVARHLARKSLRGKTVSVKLRLADFTTFTRQTTLPHLTGAHADILTEGWKLLERELLPGRAFRLIGVGVSGFMEEHQLPLPLVFEGKSAEQVLIRVSD